MKRPSYLRLTGRFEKVAAAGTIGSPATLSSWSTTRGSLALLCTIVALLLALALAVVASGLRSEADAQTAGTARYIVTDLGTLGGGSSAAEGLNESGQVVGQSQPTDGYEHAFLYENGVMKDLGTLPGGDFSEAFDINESGQVVGRSSTPDSNSRAFVYENGQMKGLGTLLDGSGNSEAPYAESKAYAINDRGQVAGWSDAVDRHDSLWPHAFFLDKAAAGSSNCTPPPNGMVGWYPGDGSARDIRGTNHGALRNGAGFSSGKVEQAFDLDGQDDYVNVPDSASLDAAASITVDAWVNFQTSPTSNKSAIFASRDPLVGEGFSMYVRNDGALEVTLRTASSPTSEGSTFATPGGLFPPGQYNLAAATYDEATGALSAYVNGLPVPLTNVDGPAVLSGPLAPTDGHFIGTGSEDPASGAHFGGSIDEVEIFDRALSQAEIQKVAGAGSAGKCKMKDLGIFAPPGSAGESFAYAINTSGQVVGESDLEGFFGTHAFLWQDNSMTDLGTLGGSSFSAAYDINDSGQVLGESSGTPFIWHNGVVTELDGIEPEAINDSGLVVGAMFVEDWVCPPFSEVCGGDAAAIWRNNEAKDLNELIDPASGWYLEEATDINDKGQIVGTGSINGQTHAFLLTPDPNYTPPTGDGGISGKVTDPESNALAKAPVQICPSAGGTCVWTGRTDSQGDYRATGLPDGEYDVTAFPPAGSSLMNPGKIGPLTISGGNGLAGQDVVLTGPKAPPEGTSVNGTPPGQIPVVIVNEPIHLETTGCSGGNATYQVKGQYGGSTGGVMAEGPAGVYTADFEISSFSGPAKITIVIACPDGSEETIEFNIYIDPSGFVRTTEGDPIAGATVRLYRSEDPGGPFEIVPDGSEIMSPSNRTNPDTTDADGHFGWDVIAGYYKVRAEKEGCVSPDIPGQAHVESRIMEIPPPVTDLDLRLDCDLDDTAPQTKPGLSREPNAAGWHKENVTVSLSATDDDGGSGVKEIVYSATGAQEIPNTTEPGDSATVDVTAEGSTTITYRATDNAGNVEAEETLVVRLDKTAPVIHCGGADDLWHKEDVSIACTANDGLSDLADHADAGFSLSTNVAAGTEDADARTGSREVRDVAGNVATAGRISGNKVDKKAPEIEITTPAAGAEYELGQAMVADYACFDGGSGRDSCAGPVASGGRLDTGSVGQKTFAVSATDRAGNAASATRTYRVVYDFRGFFQPVDNPPTLNVARAGQAVPVKFGLGGNQGPDVFAAGSPKSRRIACDSMVALDLVEQTVTAGSSNLSYAPVAGRYNYVWKTGGAWAGTCRQLIVELDDGTAHRANFRFR